MVSGKGVKSRGLRLGQLRAANTTVRRKVKAMEEASPDGTMLTDNSKTRARFGGWADPSFAGEGKASKSGGWDEQAQSQKGYDGWDYWDDYWQDWSNTGYKGWSGKGAKKKKGGKRGRRGKGKKGVVANRCPCGRPPGRQTGEPAKTDGVAREAPG